jgi:excisionase family DNA binding protein
MNTNPFALIDSRLNRIESLLEDIRESKNTLTTSQKTHFTKREAASELSCSVPMIDKLIQQGRLDKIKVGAKVLIGRDCIDRILDN